MQNFLKHLIIITAVLAAGILCWNYFAPEHLRSNTFWFSLGLLALTTLGVHAFLTDPKKTPQQFVRHFMLITFLKLFAYLIIIGVYAYLNREQAVQFILSFLLFYFIFMILEVSSLTKFVKK